MTILYKTQFYIQKQEFQTSERKMKRKRHTEKGKEQMKKGYISNEQRYRDYYIIEKIQANNGKMVTSESVPHSLGQCACSIR